MSLAWAPVASLNMAAYPTGATSHRLALVRFTHRVVKVETGGTASRDTLAPPPATPQGFIKLDQGDQLIQLHGGQIQLGGKELPAGIQHRQERVEAPFVALSSHLGVRLVAIQLACRTVVIIIYFNKLQLISALVMNKFS